MTDRYTIIHIGSPDEFVLKDTMENKTYGMFGRNNEKTMRRLCDDMNMLHEKNQELKEKLRIMAEQYDYSEKLRKMIK